MSHAPKVEQAQATQTGHVMLSRSKTEEPFAVRHIRPNRRCWSSKEPRVLQLIT